MTATDGPVEPRSDSGPGSTTVVEDVACVHCGYNLRGLSGDGRCPECFEKVAVSLRGNLLKYADTAWLRKLRFGATLKLWNILVGFGGGLISGIVSSAGVPAGIVNSIGWIGAAFGLWASFVITTQEPCISFQEDPLSWRRVIRACAIAAVAGHLFGATFSGGTFVEIFATVSRMIASMAGVIVVFGELHYLRGFALRIPDSKLARSTRIVQWGATSLLALSTVFGLIVSAGSFPAGATGAGLGPVGTVFTLVGACLFGVAGVVFFFWYVMLLSEYRRGFAHAAQASRDSSRGLETDKRVSAKSLSEPPSADSVTQPR